MRVKEDEVIVPESAGLLRFKAEDQMRRGEQMGDRHAQEQEEEPHGVEAGALRQPDAAGEDGLSHV